MDSRQPELSRLTLMCSDHEVAEFTWNHDRQAVTGKTHVRAICSSMDAVINDRPSLLVGVLSLQQNIPILTVKFRELGISLPEVVRTWQYFCRDASKVLHCVRSWQTALRPTPKPFA